MEEIGELRELELSVVSWDRSQPVSVGGGSVPRQLDSVIQEMASFVMTQQLLPSEG